MTDNLTEQDEWLDLVNEQDQVIGRQLRSQIYREGLRNFRAVHGFVVNSKGELWIPRRTLDKRIFPGGLDYSVAGHVTSGESYDDAFARELAEELNLALPTLNYCLLAHLNPHRDDVDVFMALYEIQLDETPQYNPTDFMEAFWWTPTQALAQLSQEVRSPKTSLGQLIEQFYLQDNRH